MSSTPSNSSPQGKPVAPLPPPRVPDHELLRRIGRGAYGEVWLARCATGTYRAVKIVHRQSFDHDRPFEREFEGILKFEPISRRHESQVDILHVGRNGGCFYYVMELADDQATGGQINPDIYTPRTLKSDLQFRSRLPFEEGVQIGIALATALEHLHAHGLVHRDVKPSNIIFVNGVPKLADIGLVTGVDATRSFVGTEGFAAPEGAGTAQADLYSLGKVLYEAATGKDRQEFPELPTMLRELPDREGLMELNAVIARACRHDPKDRYISAVAMLADLELLQSGKSLARLHRTEKQLRFVQRAGALVTVLATVVALGWWWQARETKVVRQLAQAKEQEHRRAEDNLYVADIQVAYRNWQSGEIAKTLKLLRRHIPQGAEPDRRGWEWYYLLSLCHRDERTLTGHTGEVFAVSCDPAGRRFASAGEDHTVRIWDAESGACLAQLKGHQDFVRSVAWSPDGSRIASGGWDGKVIIWDAESFRKLLELNYGRRVWAVAWSPDGKRIAAGGNGPNTTGYLPPEIDGLVTIWDAASGRRLQNLENVGLVRSLAWHPAGKLLATTMDEGARVQIWDADDGQLLKSIAAGGSSVAWKPDGTQLASAGLDHRIKVWDANTWNCVTTIDSAHSGPVTGVVWSEDGQHLVSCGSDGVIRIWNPQTGAVINELRGHQTGVRSVAWWRGHGRILSGGSDGTLKIWDPDSEQAARTIPGRGPLAWSPDGRRFAVGSPPGHENVGVIWFFDAATWQTLFGLPCPTNSWPAILAWSPDGRRLAVGFYPGILQVWDVAKRELAFNQPNIHGNNVRAVAWSPDGRQLATAGDDGTVHLWNVEWKENAMSSLKHPAPVNSAVWSPDGQWIASKDFDENILIWEAKTGRVKLKLRLLYGFNAGSHNICWSPQGDKLASGCGDGTIMVWDATTGRELFTLKGHSSSVASVAWSPDGRRLVSDSEDRTVHIWDAQSGRELLVLPIPADFGLSVAWSPDGRMISVADSKVMIFDATKGYELAPQLAQSPTNR